jgi:hypothetical protein
MNIKFLVILFFLTTTFTICSFGQLGDTAYSYIKTLLPKKVDTVIRLGLPGPYTSLLHNLKGLGKVSYFSVNYIFYRQQNKLWSQKIIEYCDSNCNGTKTAVSKPLTLTEFRLFNFLNTYYRQIEREDIYPFIMKFSDSLAKRDFYVTSKSSHPPVFLVGIYTKNEDLVRLINSDDLEKNIRNETPSNVNYEYNSQTKLRQLYVLLTSIVNDLDEQYQF